MSSASVIEQFVQRARSLYSLPAVAMRVLELTDHPKVDVRALKECIENDPALTTRILRVVNSSLFGLSREVCDLNQALTLLGINPLKMLVLGFSLPKNLFAALEADVLSRYWRHTLTKAVVARELAQTYWRQPGDEAFIAGLLQEIGQLVLVQDLGEPYVRFVHRVATTGGDLLTLELETLGFDHAVLSARLLERWGLPATIVHAIGTPHSSAAIAQLPASSQALPQILHLAELITRALTGPQGQGLDELIAAVGEYQRVALEDLPRMLESLNEKVTQLADVLTLQLPNMGDYRDLLADAHAQLAKVAGEAAMEMLEPQQRWDESLALEQTVANFDFSRAQHVDRVETSYAACGIDPLARSVSVSTAEASWGDPGLSGRLSAAMQTCRQHRQPLSLMLIEVDRCEDWIMQHGYAESVTLWQRLEELLAATLAPGSSSVHLGGGQFALILIDYDRAESAVTARELTKRVRELGSALGEKELPPLTISLGLASLDVPPKNFPAQELLIAARRCLAGARLSGGDTFKSIDLV